MSGYLKTSRLLLRELTWEHEENLVELNSDPEVMRYLGMRPESDIRERVLPRVLDEYVRFPGLGRFAAVEKSSDAFIGWMSLAPSGPGRAGLGYRLRRSAWGFGYATEGSLALVRKAFTELGLNEVYAETMAVNTSSRRVMEKAGLRYRRTFHVTFDDPLPGDRGRRGRVRDHPVGVAGLTGLVQA